ncbi:hypothetical protein Vi05172_g10784 [Venturia inaequalis]|nr:hypothetical protein Vi05172_g10784 [Venturia inaequalis]
MSAFLDYTVSKLQRIEDYLINSDLTPRTQADIQSVRDEILMFHPSTGPSLDNLLESEYTWEDLHQRFQTNLEARGLLRAMDNMIDAFGLTGKKFQRSKKHWTVTETAGHLAIGQCTISLYENLDHYDFGKASAQDYFETQFSGLRELRNTCAHSYHVSHPYVHSDNPYNAAKHWEFVSKRQLLIDLLDDSFCYYLAMLPEVFRRDMQNWRLEHDEEMIRRAEEEYIASFGEDRWDLDQDQKMAASWTGTSEKTTPGSEHSEWNPPTTVEPVTSYMAEDERLHNEATSTIMSLPVLCSLTKLHFSRIHGPPVAAIICRMATLTTPRISRGINQILDYTSLGAWKAVMYTKRL